MKKLILIIIGLVLVIGGGVIFFTFGKNQTKGQAILKIDSTPQAQIFFDEKEIGTTPYENKVASGEHTVKLVSETGNAITWESKINLQANLLTYINRELNENELLSGGEILVLEKISGKKAELTVISNPDQATVTFDGTDSGITPLVISDKEAGNYELTVSYSGYKSRTVKIKTTSGYKLNANFQLASISDVLASAASVSPTPAPSENLKSSPKASPKSSPKASLGASASASLKPKTSPPAKPYIQVLDTDTGYLNVRSEPSTSAEVLVKIYPGEFYTYVEEQKTGDNIWYKIKYDGDKTGWVSAKYAEKFE